MSVVTTTPFGSLVVTTYKADNVFEPSPHAVPAVRAETEKFRVDILAAKDGHLVVSILELDDEDGAVILQEFDTSA